MSLAQERLGASDLVHAFFTPTSRDCPLPAALHRARITERETVEQEVRLSLASDVLTFRCSRWIILGAYEVQSFDVVGGVLVAPSPPPVACNEVRRLSSERYV
jgi:hypothetical protein